MCACVYERERERKWGTYNYLSNDYGLAKRFKEKGEEAADRND